MNKLFDQFLAPEEDVSWDNNVDDLDSFDEINSVGVSHDYDDDRETEVFVLILVVAFQNMNLIVQHIYQKN